ncbi:MAG: AAA family ATPase, partial [Alphaproteobacteria bacterium]|nr:AAA family ATPase [Alphaproteobacteria bacterium]
MITPRLWCARLTLADFRSHAALAVELDGRPVCLHGPNGAGKTNILEALTMLAPGRGLRGAALMDVARGGAEEAVDRARPWAVSARMVVDGDDLALGAGAERTDAGVKRIARLNGRAATAGDLARAVR